METTLEETVRKYLEIKSTIESMSETLKTLDEQIKAAMVSGGLKSVRVDSKVVSLVESSSRTFDTKKLKDLVPPSVFKDVTEVAVKTRLFDAALALGKIKDEVVEQVVNKTPYSQLRVK